MRKKKYFALLIALCIAKSSAHFCSEQKNTEKDGYQALLDEALKCTAKNPNESNMCNCANDSSAFGLDKAQKDDLQDDLPKKDLDAKAQQNDSPSKQNEVIPPPNTRAKHTLLLIYENDSNFDPHIDKYYTAGISLKFYSKDLQKPTNKGFYTFMHAISAPTFFPKALSRYLGEEADFATSFGVSLSQEMYAPKDRFSNPPPKSDHPYGGFLYASVMLQNRFKYILEQFEVALGLVGKDALAKQAQDTIHEARNVKKLAGWDTQLQNEGIFNLYYRASFSIPQVYEKSKHIVDIMPQVSFAAGNAKSHAQANLIARVGYNLSANSLMPHINSGFVSTLPNRYGFSIEGYVGLGIRAVVRNIFLQGNSFAPRKDIEIYNGVGEFIFGVSLNYKRFFLSYSAITRTKEFVSQDMPTTFGSILLGVSF